MGGGGGGGMVRLSVYDSVLSNNAIKSKHRTDD